MRPLPKPKFTVDEVYRECISKVKDENLKSHLESCLPEINRDSQEFDAKATVAQLHLFPKKTLVNGMNIKHEIIKVYTDRMVGGPGRGYYEKLKNPEGVDKCPLCGHLPINTLDHYLAKTDYPTLAVTPNNLVPACRDCNTIKNAVFPTKSEEETLHPYFDNIDGEQWLFAKVLQTSPVSVSYFIKPPSNASQLLAERVNRHFKLYKLNTLYKSQASEEITDIAYLMKDLLAKAGPNAVQLHLSGIANSCFLNRRNSWRTALYQALAKDQWYCSVGAGF